MANRGAQYSAAIQLTVTGAQQIKKDIGKAAKDAVDAADQGARRGGRRPSAADQEKTLGRRRFGNAMFEMSRAAEDFGQQLSVSLDQAIRASANNVTQAFAVTGNQMLGMAASVTTALYFIVPTLLRLTEATDKWGEHIDIQRQRIADFDEELQLRRSAEQFGEDLDRIVAGPDPSRNRLSQITDQVDELNRRIKEHREQIQLNNRAIDATIPGLSTGDSRAVLLRQLQDVKPGDLQEMLEMEEKISALKAAEPRAEFGAGNSMSSVMQASRDREFFARKIREAELEYEILLRSMGVTAGIEPGPRGRSDFQMIPPSWLEIAPASTARYGPIGKAIEQIRSKDDTRQLAMSKAEDTKKQESEIRKLNAQLREYRNRLQEITRANNVITMTENLQKAVKRLNDDLKDERATRSFKERLSSMLDPKAAEDPWQKMTDDLQRDLADIDEHLKLIEAAKERHRDPRHDVNFDPKKIPEIDAQVLRLQRRRETVQANLNALEARGADIAQRRLQIERDKLSTQRQSAFLEESGTEGEMAALRRAKDQMIRIQQSAGVGQWGFGNQQPLHQNVDEGDPEVQNYLRLIERNTGRLRNSVRVHIGQ